MTIEKYNYFVNEIKKDCGFLVEKAQKQLAKSKSKKKDFNALHEFWYGFSVYALTLNRELTHKYYEVFTDNQAIMPMPMSVQKQLSTRLFKIKHLNVLQDLPIEQGLY